jgi:hypothetical protein
MAARLLTSLEWDAARNPEATTSIPVLVHPSATLSDRAHLPPRTRVVTPQDLETLRVDVDAFAKELAAANSWSDTTAVRQALTRHRLTAETVIEAHSSAMSRS